MNKEKFLKILMVLSLILLTFSSVSFAYAKMRYNSYEAEKRELESIKKELQTINDEVKNNTELLNSKNQQLNNESVDFLTTYGFDYLKEDDELIQDEIKLLSDENTQIKNSIKDELKKYVHYFDGTYYEIENFSGIVAKVTNIDNSDFNEQMNANIYDELEIDDFINQANSSGTIGYLASINNKTKFNNILFFTTAMYSDNLYEISHDLTDVPDNLNSVYNNILATQQIFKSLEECGINTGTLSSKGLDELVFNTENLIKKYYENQSIIEKLTGEKYEDKK